MEILPEWVTGTTDEWHYCHFCGELVRDGKDTNGDRHWLSDCRPDLTEHEPGPLCTWPHDAACYAEHEKGIHYVYKDGPT